MRIFFKRSLFVFLSFVLNVGAVGYAQILQPPSNVQNVEAEALNQSVRLTWDEATDEGSIISYKVYYGVTPVTEETVDEQGGYDNEVDTESDDTGFTVDRLINNNKYYFAVTAVDEQGQESELYSVETSATPVASGGDGAPFLKETEHTAFNKVLVVMSEAVEIDDTTSAFQLTEDFTGEPVNILNTLVNSEQVTLVVAPNALTPNTNYRVTATTGVTDLDGNPVSSGVVDSIQFLAKSEFPIEAPVVEEEPEEEEETVPLEEEEEDEVLIADPEPPVVPEPDNSDTFFLNNDSGNSDTNDFLESLLDPNNPINNLDNNTAPLVPVENPDSPTPLSAAPSSDDQTPPQDARNLQADTSDVVNGQVMVSWEPSLDIDDDVKDQIIYTRVGIGAWDNGISLGKDASQVTINVEPNTNYQIRLVTTDNANNESFGASFDFSTNLVQSGGGQGTVIALSVIAMVGFLFLFAGRRA